MWRTGLVAPWRVGSSWTRARTRVPCIGRRILSHQGSPCAPLFRTEFPKAGVTEPGEGKLFRLISLASFPSRCTACIRLLSVPSYSGPIHDLMCLLLFLNIFLCPSVPQESIAMPPSCSGKHKHTPCFEFPLIILLSFLRP